MLDEYAVMPEIFSPPFIDGEDGKANAVRVALLLLNILEHGMIADLHNGAWRKEIGQRIKAIPDHNLREDLMWIFDLLKDRNRIVPCAVTEQGESGDDRWLRQAQAIHKQTQLDAIWLTPDQQFQKAGKTNVCQVVDNVIRWSCERSDQPKIFVPCKDQYKDRLRRVLKYAHTVYLIDPYISPCERRWQIPITLCANHLGWCRKDRKLERRIEIHTGDPTKRSGKSCRSRDQEIRCWEEWKQQAFDPEYGGRVSLSISLWSTKSDNDRFHDRFLMTNQVGFAVGRGLDCIESLSSNKVETTWLQLARRDYEHWLEKFNVNGVSGPFSLIKTIS